MPNPKSLKVDDLVRFIAIPHEWSQPAYTIHRDSIAFMRALIRRTWPSRIVRLDESGFPWIKAKMKQRGKWHYHSWMITESTGWRLVNHRNQHQ